jgi:hypothetical protein
MRVAGPVFPLAQSPNDQTPEGAVGYCFGSYHPGICPFVFCDGSVRSLMSSIDPNVLGLLACRDDGQVIPNYSRGPWPSNQQIAPKERHVLRGLPGRESSS